MVMTLKEFGKLSENSTYSGDAGLSRKKIYILTPCYNDFESLHIFLSNIDAELNNHDICLAHVIVINDGSTDTLSGDLRQWFQYSNIVRIEQIDLIRNMGHQRAISIGLAYINDRGGDYDGVIVTDCDGEDNYLDIFRMIREISDDTIILAMRRKRRESLSFRVPYIFYKLFFQFLTGYALQGGNFSLIPRKLLIRVVHHVEIWNHYHAGILKSKLKLKYIECDRGDRYKGKSKMNFVSLVTHGLSSMSVFNENVFVRLILLASVFLGMSGIVIAVVLILKFVLHAATPGWATSAIGITAILCMQFLLMVLNCAFLYLGNRNIADFLPARDYKNYILNVVTVK